MILLIVRSFSNTTNLRINAFYILLLVVSTTLRLAGKLMNVGAAIPDETLFARVSLALIGYYVNIVVLILFD